MKFIDKSIKLSYEFYPFSNERFSHYCFIFDKNRLLSIGKNNTKVKNFKALYFGSKFNAQHFVKYPFAHAEVSAIGKLWGKQHITGKERIVVIRVGPSGLLDSYPCSNCSTILRAIGFNKVYHSISGDVIESNL